MGRSRGGLTTKIHALVDANGLPVALKLTEGQAHDGRSAADMLQGLGAGQILIADRAYDSDLLRQNMTARGVFANIKPLARRLDKPAFSPFLYRSRNRVERFFNKLKHFRAVATRYEKHAANYLALVKLAATRIGCALMSRCPASPHQPKDGQGDHAQGGCFAATDTAPLLLVRASEEGHADPAFALALYDPAKKRLPGITPDASLAQALCEKAAKLRR